MNITRVKEYMEETVAKKIRILCNTATPISFVLHGRYWHPTFNPGSTITVNMEEYNALLAHETFVRLIKTKGLIIEEAVYYTCFNPNQDSNSLWHVIKDVQTASETLSIYRPRPLCNEKMDHNMRASEKTPTQWVTRLQHNCPDICMKCRVIMGNILKEAEDKQTDPPAAARKKRLFNQFLKS